ncbi:MAG: 3'(2'),5'-bisphosphate nucleotidase CysQ [wastewater metagenome]|nr:3'(2'),5'-bisphosphate nucleotidase CysQ [Candidatus Loosdrechtia aerotolerans]
MNNNEYEVSLVAAVTAAKEAGDAILKVYNSDFSVEQKEDDSPLTLADKQSHEIITEHLSQMKHHHGHHYFLLSEEGKDIPYTERKDWEYFWLIDPLDGTKEFIKRNGEFTVNIALIHHGQPVLGVIYAPVPDVFYFAAKGAGAYKLPDCDKRLNGYWLEGENNNTLEGLKKISRKLPLTDGQSTAPDSSSSVTIVASRSHLSKETEDYISGLKQRYRNIGLISTGSSLKFCLVAEGMANIYPRFAPTMEWDTAAGQAIVEEVGGKVIEFETGKPLQYNKEKLVNPWFIASFKE